MTFWHRRALGILLLFIHLTPLFSQEKVEREGVVTVGEQKVKIIAKIVDSDNEPLYMAAVVLRDKENNLLAIEYADEKGEVIIEITADQKPTVVVISMVGFHSIRKEIKSTAPATHLGTFTLLYNATLDAAIVVAPQLVSYSDDAYIYNVEKDPRAKETKIVHLLEKLPFIEVEFNNRVTIFGGSTKILYLLNGKRTPLFSSGLTMKSITGLNIKTMELLPNPTEVYRNYDAIINIVTRRSLFEGLIGEVELRSTLSAYSFNPGGYLELVTNIKKLSLVVRGGYGVTIPTSDNYSFSERSSDPSSPLFQEPFNSVKRESSSTSRGNNSNFIIQGSYLLTPKRSLSLLSQHVINSNNRLSNSSTLYNGGPLDDFSLKNELNRNYQLHFGVVTYSTEKLRESGGSLKYKYNITSDKSDELITKAVEGSDQLSNRLYYNNSLTHEVNYNRNIKFNRKSSLSLDSKVLFDNKSTNGDLYSYNGLESIWEVEQNSTNYLNNIRWSAELLASYSIKIRKHSLTVTAAPTYIGDYSAYSPTQGSMAHNSYWTLTPSFNYSITPRFGILLRVLYNRAYTLPSPLMTNPYYDTVDPLFITKGNPNLSPESSDVLSIFFVRQKRGTTFSLILGYVHTEKAIEAVREVNEEGATISTYENLGKKEIASVRLHYNQRLSRTLNANANLRYSKRLSKFKEINYSTDSYSLTTSLTYRPHRQLNINFGGDIIPSRERDDIQSGKIYYLFKSLLRVSGNTKDMKFNWGLQVTSLEKSNRTIKSEDYLNGYILRSSRIDPGRTVVLTLSYAFGKVSN